MGDPLSRCHHHLLPDITATDFKVSVPGTPGSASQRYYRILALPQPGWLRNPVLEDRRKTKNKGRGAATPASRVHFFRRDYWTWTR